MRLRIPYVKSSSKDEAFEEIKKKVSKEALSKMNIEADLMFDDNTHFIRAEGKGFSLRLYCYDTEAEAELELGFLLKPLKGKIEGLLKSKISKIV